MEVDADSVPGGPECRREGCRDLPSGSVVKNLPCNVGGMGLIPGQGTKNPQTASN